jgi:hypothetical protein
VLTLAFFQECIDNWGPGTVEANTLCTADYANIAPIETPNWQGPNPYDTLTAAQIRAAVVGGINQSNGWQQEQLEPLASSNPGYQVPNAVDYNPTSGIRVETF